MNISGLKIISNPHMMDSTIVSRSWRERLFSLTPWAKMKIVVKPSDKIFIVGNMAIMHPIKREQLRQEMKLRDP